MASAVNDAELALPKDIKDTNDPTSTSNDDTEPSPTRMTRVRAFLKKHLLAFSLIAGVLLGVAWPYPGVQVMVAMIPIDANVHIAHMQVGKKVNGVSPAQYIFVIIIFLISGLKLKVFRIYPANCSMNHRRQMLKSLSNRINHLAGEFSASCS